MVALIGSNGAGKTTLLRALSGVQPISDGQVTFLGERIDGLPAYRRVARGILQSPEGGRYSARSPWRTTLPAWRLSAARQGHRCRSRQDLRHVSNSGREAKSNSRGRVRRTAADAGHRPCFDGQTKAAAAGRTFARSVTLCLLIEILTAIVSLRALGMTVLLVEQNAMAALEIADRGYVIETGHIVHAGPASQLLSDPKVKAAYLGPE